MGGLLTLVILSEEAKLILQVVGIQGFQQALGDGLAALLLATTQSCASRPLGCPCHLSLSLPATEFCVQTGFIGYALCWSALVDIQDHDGHPR